MPSHLLKSSSEVIEDLLKLGRALGYDVVPEFDISDANGRGQAIDVVWMRGREQRFPLFIFEVESFASNAASNNAVKVFGKRTFEKPLFFFHVFVKAGARTSRLGDLQEEFGNRNYKVFNLSADEGSQLLNAILHQHRRLTNRLNIFGLVDAVASKTWTGIDIHRILARAESLGFNAGRGRVLPAYATLAARDESFSNDFIRYLSARRDGKSPPENDRYGTHFGDSWPTPIHLALLSCLQPDPTNPRYFNKLLEWHNRIGPYLKVGPMFGLNMDFDSFLVYHAAPFYALLCSLLRNVSGAIAALSEHLTQMWAQLRPDVRPVWSHPATWILHILAGAPDGSDAFDAFRAKVNGRGGIAEEFLRCPLGGADLVAETGELDDGRDVETAFRTNLVLIPELRQFKHQYCVQRLDEHDRRRCAVRLAMRLLSEESESLLSEIASETVAVLHSRSVEVSHMSDGA